MTDKPSLLACRRYEDLTPAQAAATGSVVRRCDRCARRVWVVPRNLVLVARLVCRPCAALLNAEALLVGKPVVIVPARPFSDKLSET